MFAIGEYVACGSKGVCVVENVTKLDLTGVDKEREYYILKPLYQSSSTIYVPVNSSKESMRDLISKDEAESLLRKIPEMAFLEIPNDKMTENAYREAMRTNLCEEWARVVKTIHERKQKRLQTGRKVTAVDTKYFHIAQESLCGELAVALGMAKEEVEEHLASLLSNGVMA